MISRSWGISKGASLAPQEIKMLLAVLPETKSQGLFHQIHKEVTFCGLSSRSSTLDFVLHRLSGVLVEVDTDDIGRACLSAF